MQAIERYGDKFTADFAENKKILDQVAIIRSKGLKNEIAGYITNYVKRDESSNSIISESDTDAESEVFVDETIDNTAEDIAEDMAETSEEIEIVEETVQESS